MTVKELEELVEIYGTAIYSFCCYLTGSVQTAEDLYQNILLKALEKREKISVSDGEKPEQKYLRPKNYLLGMGIRLWKKEKTRYRHSVSLEDKREEAFQGITGEGDPEETVETREMIHTLQCIVSELPDKWRTVILLFYTGEMKLGEIAKVLRIPVGTVKSRLYHAKMQIKKEMEEQGYEIKK